MIERVGKYVASYGEKAAVVVASEKYTQSVLVDGADMGRPRELKAEFAIVRVAGGAWTGYRDVIEFEGKPVQDRTRSAGRRCSPTPPAMRAKLIRIANESARFNVGPISRNFNVPTAAMFFFYARGARALHVHAKGIEEDRGHRHVGDRIQGDAGVQR